MWVAFIQSLEDLKSKIGFLRRNSTSRLQHQLLSELPVIWPDYIVWTYKPSNCMIWLFKINISIYPSKIYINTISLINITPLNTYADISKSMHVLIYILCMIYSYMFYIYIFYTHIYIGTLIWGRLPQDLSGWVFSVLFFGLSSYSRVWFFPKSCENSAVSHESMRCSSRHLIIHLAGMPESFNTKALWFL